MYNQNSPTEEQIVRFLNNECVGSKEADAIAEFLEHNPKILENYLTFNERWTKNEEVFTDRIRNELKRKVLKKIQHPNHLRLPTYLTAAAIVALLLIGPYFFRKTEILKNNLTDIKVMVIENKTNRDSLLFLTDGSQIVLSGNSKITLAGNYRINRKILLTGTALFKVSKDTAHPFVVNSGELTTRALGTEFWVKTNNVSRTISVLLLEGSVVVYHPGDKEQSETYLKVGEELVFRKRDKKTSVRNIASAQPVNVPPPAIEAKKQEARTTKIQTESLWTNKSYSTSKATLSDLFKNIEKRYNVTIDVEHNLIRNIRFTGEIMYDDKLDVLLSTICNLNNLTYTRRKDSIFIHQPTIK